MVEQKVARVDDLRDGEMMEVDVAGSDILLVRHAGQYYAVGATCPHHGAPLSEGTLGEGRLTCPWHASVFDVVTGDVVEPPTLDALPRLEVRIRDEDVYILVPDVLPKSRTMSMAQRDPARDDRLFAIVGGGPAAQSAAESLRQCGYQGRIVMISQDPHKPYDRTYASKHYLAGKIGEQKLPLRDDEFYRQHAIDWIQATVTALDVHQRTITLADGQTLHPDAILVATGGIPRSLEVPGADLPGVMTLRTWDDSFAIRQSARAAERIVIIGSSFIGMEAAASLSGHDLVITVVSPQTVPFERVFGNQIGLEIQRLHEANGIRFRMGRRVVALHGDGHVRGVELDDGSHLDADLVLQAIGVHPATGFLRGIDLNQDDSVDVDENLQITNGVYAAGDIARYPDPFSGRRVRIEHWRLAQQHGRKAGQRMVQWGSAFSSVPFFWTTQFGESFDYAGYADQWDEIVITGDLPARQFSAYYAGNNRLLAILSTNSRHIARFMEQMRLGRLPSADDIRPHVSRDPEIDLLRAAALARV